MCQDMQNSFLLYGDHGSDTLVKLCGRPDCDHTGQDCNAYFPQSGSSVCYYDGYLYVTTIGGGAKLYRMNPDGSRPSRSDGFQECKPWIWIYRNQRRDGLERYFLLFPVSG